MVSNYFAVLLIISIFIVIYIALKNYENIDIYYWTIVILAPLILLSYWLMTRVRTREGAMIALCFEYLDSTVMLMVVLFAILNFMRVKVNKWIKGFAYTLAFAHMFLVWCCIDNALYYKSIRMINTGLGMTVRIENGPLKVIHWGYLTVMMIVLLGVIALAWLRRGTYSRRTLTVYTILVLTGLGIYIVETVLRVSFSLLPTLYVIADIFVALNYDRDHIYDIPNLVSKQYDKMNSRGYVAVDTEGLYLGSNMKSFDFFPELELQIVDTKLKAGMSADIFYGLIEEFRENHTDHKIFNIGDMVCRCEVSEFSLRKNGVPQGYMFDVRDITEEQRVISVMQDYNDTLNAEVNKQIEKNRKIQGKVVMGLADMADAQDEYTKGHVVRAVGFCKILIDEIKKQKMYILDDEYVSNIMSALPMYDLGLVSIDHSLRQKRHKLTKEEYEIYKAHVQKSVDFVHIILDEVENENFIKVASNIAKYHHEHWDGRGYPEGLVGEMIPLEARIVALADSYDSSISERYENAISKIEDKSDIDENELLDKVLNESAEIIEEQMGCKFDPNLQMVFLACRSQLEDAYKSNIEGKMG